MSHSAGTPIDCSCLIFSGIAENDEVVAVEDFIDVGNILGKSWVSLYSHSTPRKKGAETVALGALFGCP